MTFFIIYMWAWELDVRNKMRYTFYFTENIVFVLYKAYSSLPDIKANHLTIAD
jgi:hypothetical protein